MIVMVMIMRINVTVTNDGKIVVRVMNFFPHSLPPFPPNSITSPLLLIAVAACLGACYLLSLRNAETKMVLGGMEIAPAHQYAAVGVLSLPLFYLVGAGAVLFWVLGEMNVGGEG